MLLSTQFAADLDLQLCCVLHLLTQLSCSATFTVSKCSTLWAHFVTGAYVHLHAAVCKCNYYTPVHLVESVKVITCAWQWKRRKLTSAHNSILDASVITNCAHNYWMQDTVSYTVHSFLLTRWDEQEYSMLRSHYAAHTNNGIMFTHCRHFYALTHIDLDLYYCVYFFFLEKVYFKSQILVHEYWTFLDHFGIPVL